MKKTVTNDQFLTALNNRDNHNVLYSAAAVFAKAIDEDDLDQCCRIALWKALQDHDDRHPSAQKFTSSLHRFVRWECLNYLRAQRRAQRRNRTFLPIVKEPQTSCLGAFLQEHLSHLTHTEQETMHQFYFEKRSLREIASLTGESVSCVRDRIELAVGRLRILAGVCR